MTWVSLSISVLGGAWFVLGAWWTTLPRRMHSGSETTDDRDAESNAFSSH